jgi:hypothetical protein
MNQLIAIILALIALVINVIIISHTAYKNKKLTCDRYVLNTYLYVSLAILIINLMIVVNSGTNIMENMIPMLYGSLLGVIIQLLIIFALFFYFATLDPTKDKVLIHSVWVLIMVLLGIMLYPLVLLNKANSKLGMVLLVSLSLVILSGVLGNKYGDVIVQFDWDKYLYTALIFLVVLSLGLQYSGTLNSSNYIYITWAILIVFILLLIAYNKKLVENSKTCLEHNNPNYLKESLGLFTKIMNVFASISRLMGRRRRF